MQYWYTSRRSMDRVAQVSLQRSPCSCMLQNSYTTWPRPKHCYFPTKFEWPTTGRTLRKFTQLKRNKRFDNFIMLVWVQGSPFHIAAGSHPVQEAWGSQDSLYRGQIQKLLQCCRESYQQIPLVITIQKKSIVWPIYDVPFRSYWKKGQRSIFWLYRGQTGKYGPILLAMVSKCSSSKYNSNPE